MQADQIEVSYCAEISGAGILHKHLVHGVICLSVMLNYLINLNKNSTDFHCDLYLILIYFNCNSDLIVSSYSSVLKHYRTFFKSGHKTHVFNLAVLQTSLNLCWDTKMGMYVCIYLFVKEQYNRGTVRIAVDRTVRQ